MRFEELVALSILISKSKIMRWCWSIKRFNLEVQDPFPTESLCDCKWIIFSPPKQINSELLFGWIIDGIFSNYSTTISITFDVCCNEWFLWECDCFWEFNCHLKGGWTMLLEIITPAKILLHFLGKDCELLSCCYHG